MVNSSSALFVILVSILSVCWPNFSFAWEQGDWLFRVRAVTYQPRERSTITPIGGSVAVEHIESPEVDITYFFTDHIAVEGLLGLVNPDVGARNTSVGNRDVGDVWVAAPTAVLQVHPLSDRRISPYLGAGLTYAFFLNPDYKSVDNINYRDGLGYVLQAGLDYHIDERWSFNVDFKKIFIGSHISANSGSINSKVDFDPWVLGVGVGYRF